MDLQEAYQYLDYEASLDFSPAAKANTSPNFYIEREGDQYEEIKFDLLNKDGYNKLLFTGHLGSGKSTELNRLANDQEIKDRFLVVYYMVKSVLDILNLDHIALLISLGARSFEAAVDSKIKMDRHLLEKVLGWANTTKMIEKEDQELAGADVALGVKSFFGKFLLRLKREHQTRETIKEIFEPRLSDLINFINEIMDGVRLGLDAGKDLLIIIDDLEKISLPLADDIFFKIRLSLDTTEV